MTTRPGATVRLVRAFLAVSCSAALAIGCSGVRHASSEDGRIVTRSAVRSIEIGMSEADVVSRLGAPAGYETPPLYGGKTLRYGKDGPARQVRTVLWVHLDRKGTVVEVYSKLYKDWSLGDDDEIGTYGLSRGRRAWQSPAFARAFPERP